MSRAKWKGPFVDWYRVTLSKKKIYPNMWSRSSMIPRKIANTIVCVHNGKEFKRVIITTDKVGFKLGEFSFTRKLEFKKPVRSSKSKKIQSKKPLPKKK